MYILSVICLRLLLLKGYVVYEILYYIILWFLNIKVYIIFVWCELVWYIENEIFFKRRLKNFNVWNIY